MYVCVLGKKRRRKKSKAKQCVPHLSQPISREFRGMRRGEEEEGGDEKARGEPRAVGGSSVWVGHCTPERFLRESY